MVIQIIRKYGESVIEHLINDFYIVTYDVRGAGLSSIPKRIRDYRLERLSLDLQEVVDEGNPKSTVPYGCA